MGRYKGNKNLNIDNDNLFGMVERFGVNYAAGYFNCTSRAIYHRIKKSGGKITKEMKIKILYNVQGASKM